MLGSPRSSARRRACESGSGAASTFTSTSGPTEASKSVKFLSLISIPRPMSYLFSKTYLERTGSSDLRYDGCGCGMPNFPARESYVQSTLTPLFLSNHRPSHTGVLRRRLRGQPLQHPAPKRAPSSLPPARLARPFFYGDRGGFRGWEV